MHPRNNGKQLCSGDENKSMKTCLFICLQMQQQNILGVRKSGKTIKEEEKKKKNYKRAVENSEVDFFVEQSNLICHLLPKLWHFIHLP